MLDGHRRHGAAIRHAFIQHYGGERQPGPLQLFVRERRGSALQQYLLLNLVAGLGEPWDSRVYAAEVWGRALGRTSPGADATTSRNWRWLVEARLVETKKERRMVKPFLRLDDGSGAPYTKPKAGQYFTLPRQYFAEAWHTQLELAETATLLVALSSARGAEWFELRAEPLSERVGISADTLRRGLDGLIDRGLLTGTSEVVVNPLARHGRSRVNKYRLASWLLPSPRSGGQ